MFVSREATMFPTGFFSAHPAFASFGPEEAVVETYTGNTKVIDVAFRNRDAWSLEEVPPQSTALLVAHREDAYGLHYGYGASRPNAPAAPTTVIWNKQTIDGQRTAWPEQPETFFRRNSRDSLANLM